MPKAIAVQILLAMTLSMSLTDDAFAQSCDEKTAGIWQGTREALLGIRNNDNNIDAMRSTCRERFDEMCRQGCSVPSDYSEYCNDFIGESVSSGCPPVEPSCDEKTAGIWQGTREALLGIRNNDNNRNAMETTCWGRFREMCRQGCGVPRSYAKTCDEFIGWEGNWRCEGSPGTASCDEKTAGIWRGAPEALHGISKNDNNKDSMRAECDLRFLTMCSQGCAVPEGYAETCAEFTGEDVDPTCSDVFGRTNAISMAQSISNESGTPVSCWACDQQCSAFTVPAAGRSDDADCCVEPATGTRHKLLSNVTVSKEGRFEGTTCEASHDSGPCDGCRNVPGCGGGFAVALFLPACASLTLRGRGRNRV